MSMRCRGASVLAPTAPSGNKRPAVIDLLDCGCLKPIVHPAQPVGDDAHHLQRKIRRLLHQEFEAFFVDFNEAAGGFGDGAGAARYVVEQGHFTQNTAGAEAFDEFAFDQQIDFTFDDDVHGNAVGVTFAEDDLTCRNGEGVCFVAENLDRDQLASPGTGRCVNMKKL